MEQNNNYKLLEKPVTNPKHDRSRVISIAIKSNCGQYRYVLKRIWNTELEVGAFLCANPSKADHLLYDETVFKCNNLAVQWNWGGFYILNLYPHYSTDPKKKKQTLDTDIKNSHYIKKISERVSIFVLACGNGHKIRTSKLIEGISKEKLFCLRINKGGGFLHPSRINPEEFDRPIRVFGEEAYR
ncbi:DUF1643 domain-containing protein [Desulfobotulus mexicanus]|uniref:DUF1643 domain-containing protein n=1 Tax=Desulfobotulus mexicanus TaxID=2586642 RepID=A0A5Q4VE54_9BACT|nr:DUF1643 domain-containing protein [Desulfobotulus mexicanus]TYT75228.1 DUF1643 domain-containing protein [Desulfobotulus mexicanus]